jgi:parallel beta-helix repeat protein
MDAGLGSFRKEINMLFMNFVAGCLRFALPLELMLGGTILPAQPAGDFSDSRTITVAQSGKADVIGSDNTALQEAANMLRPGDKLFIGPGIWRMNDKLVIPCSKVIVSGTPDKTILLKSPAVSSRVVDCGDYGERVLVVAEPEKFYPGMGITVQDDAYRSGWDVTVTSIQEVNGDTLKIEPYTVRDYNYETGNSKVENKFPILTAYQQEEIVFENIIVDGNRTEGTGYIDGCRGGGIYLYDSRNCTIRNCEVRHYNGDGISFQITDGIKVINCNSHHNYGYGIHPGTGSSNAEITGCHFHHNDQIGFFLCWRVRYGTFTDNLIEHNGQYGISIGHKDTDNLFEKNTIRSNGFCGVLFRKETKKLSGHRNVFRNNTIADNGSSKQGYGVYVEPFAGDILFENNVIEETRTKDIATQQFGIYLKKDAGSLKSVNNTFRGHLKGDMKDEN